MIPKVWGKHFWMCIHLTAIGYPNNPTSEEKRSFKAFFEAVGKVLPCKKCILNYERHTSLMSIDHHLSDRRALFNWTVYLHNSVNKELGKPLWNTDYAWAHYKNVAVNAKPSSESPGEGGSHGKMTTMFQRPFYVMGGLNVVCILIIAWLIMRARK